MTKAITVCSVYSNRLIELDDIYFISGAVSFSLTVESNNTDQELVLESNENNVIIDNLTPGGWYIVRVTSFGAQERSNPTASEALVFQTSTVI